MRVYIARCKQQKINELSFLYRAKARLLVKREISLITGDHVMLLFNQSVNKFPKTMRIRPQQKFYLLPI